MPILLFLIDTSASMNQRTDLGTSYLDIAKGAVELFLKLRARDPASRGDRYMLVTYDEPPYCIKAGWKENHATFMNELKNLQASGLTTLGQALRSSFDLLNLNRLISGIDNYGQANVITVLGDHWQGKCKSLNTIVLLHMALIFFKCILGEKSIFFRTIYFNYHHRWK
ncbi:integrator complex subunit 6-like isoform X13 [Pipistrellus kuhlii]|uniref:integrator complex subunit 6-like isoform X13 n=1 Tax=Pipistrellus kuhlii TaxID=59472 RepID=UPI00174F69FC|nr:integrator complex subunit 6-like isoform X13 [Pipistrellus kuhlii]